MNHQKRKEVSNFGPPKVDIKLVRAVKEGDVEAFEKLFNILHDRVYYFVFSYAKSTYVADEIVQEVFIRIWQKRADIKSLTFTTLLFTIAKNLTFNHLRDAFRRESAKQELWDNINAQYEQIEHKMRLEEYQQIIDKAVDTLSEKKKLIYHLSKEVGKTNSEIAEILGISPKTVKNHLWKTMDVIKSHLRPHIENFLSLVIYLLLFV